ncbi:MAG: aldo/keto reductase [Acidobacteriota bacterium]|jgi:aryl-alcohol dehydrogenase-like predicted oxidoreductase/enamine deaminase RidA (YjgF/YER057c/UK114 family)
MGPDLNISRIVTGLWQIADMERDGRKLDLAAAARAMQPYVEAGLTTFDMADHYGSAEEIVGLFRAGEGEGDVELLTKWVPQPGATSREQVREAVERSLCRMQGERLDLLQFHAWNYADPRYLDTLWYLQELKDEGLIRYLGLTNTDTAHLRMIVETGIEIASNQVCFSLLDQRARVNGMTALCRERGITLLAFGVLAGGFLSERWLGAPEPDEEGLETWSQMKYGRFVREAGGWALLQQLLEALRQVGQKHRVSIANVASRAILDEPGVGGIIVGARLGVSEHIADNLRSLALVLDDQDRARIDEALAALHPIPGDCGDEYRRPPFLTASGDLSHHLDEFPAPYVAETGVDGRVRVSSGTSWEEVGGYSRAVRVGKRIFVSGTTASHGDRLIGGADPASQAHFIFDKIEGALQSLGGALAEVVRTRVYVRDIEHWEAVARVHGQRLGAARPANTLVQAPLVGADHLVEIEAEAEVAD